MTPEELALLQQIGKSLRQSFAAIIVKTFLYALYVVCFVKAVRILRRKNVGWMMGVNMSITILLFLMASTLISLDISNFVTEINTTFVDNSGTVLDESYGEANSATFKRVLGIDAVYGYMTVLGDAIIIWRVHAFWGEGRQRWVLYILYAMLLGSIVTACLLNYCVAALGTQLFLGGFQHPLFCRNIQITSYAMPAATTFVATTLIALTFWEYSRTVRPDLSSPEKRNRVEKIFLILVESGFLYFIFFLYTVLCNEPRIANAIAARPNLTFVNFMVSFSASIIVACYPTVIIILAHSERTTLENTTVGAISTHLTFARDSQSAHCDNVLGDSRGTHTRVEEEEIELRTSHSLPSGDRNSHEKKGRAMLPF